MSKLQHNSITCPYCKGILAYDADGKVYSRLIAVYDQQKDRTVAWRCPFCGKEDER